MSSVFLSNVDDYLVPSQACVNPMFADSTNGNNGEPAAGQTMNGGNVISSSATTMTTATTDPSSGAVVPRRKRRVRRRVSHNNTAAASIPQTPPSSSSPAKVSMADCLACSGCVTTAETVLVEQHSLDTMRQMLRQRDATNKVKVAFTVSPASWADLIRVLLQLKEDESENGNSNSMQQDEENEEHDQVSIREMQQRLASFLHEHCGASIVLDGSLPLQWSLLETAKEFCRAYTEKQSLQSQSAATLQLPTLQHTLSSSSPNKSSNTNTASCRPMLASSCPAFVCLVEKSTPAAVPHLCSTKSPMAAAGAYLKSQHNNNNSHYSWLHIAIMPCHDKKLEASRRDLMNKNIPDVDLVITTEEWWRLLQETYQTKDPVTIRQCLSKLTPARVETTLEALCHNSQPGNSNVNDAGVALLVPRTITTDDNDDGDVVMADAATTTATNPDPTTMIDSFFALGSGGYADFCFRYASHTLFGTRLPEGNLPWTPVPSNAKSARVKSRRDFYQVTLYRHGDNDDGTQYYSCHKSSNEDVPVLRFATAYGLQTLQRVLQPFTLSLQQQQQENMTFDYVEAMACPSGCPNGGGQVRLSSTTSSGSMDPTTPALLQSRETPTETRQRVRATQQAFQHLVAPVSGGEYSVSATCAPQPTVIPQDNDDDEWMHTQFHVVPPLQHTTGATAGVKVQDTQW